MFVPHMEHISSPLCAQHVNAIHRSVYNVVLIQLSQFWTLSIVLSFIYNMKFRRLVSVTMFRW
jgi:hypothetical protein